MIVDLLLRQSPGSLPAHRGLLPGERIPRNKSRIEPLNRAEICRQAGCRSTVHGEGHGIGISELRLLEGGDFNSAVRSSKLEPPHVGSYRELAGGTPELPGAGRVLPTGELGAGMGS